MRGADVRTWVQAHRGAAAAIAAVGIAAIAFGIYWFAPQRLVLDRSVNEPAPDAVVSPTFSPGESPGGAVEPSKGSTTTFRSLEHETTGRASIVVLADGARYVRFEDLVTSDGPDLRVYLTDQPVSDDWHVWDDGRYVDLGALKGNLGNANYRIPDDIDLDAFRTVVIWCRRFTVGFAVAPLPGAPV